jgi:hypothetical protein
LTAVFLPVCPGTIILRRVDRCHAMSKKLKLVVALVAIVLIYRLAVKE